MDVGPEALVLRVRAPGETRFVILAAGRKGKGAAVGITEHRPWKGGGLPDGEKLRLRARLEGARVEALGPRWIALGKGETRLVVEAGERLVVREAAPTEALGADAADAALAEDAAAWIEAGAQLARELGDGVIRGRQAELSRALRRAAERVGRRVSAIEGDLARIAATEGAAARASLFVAEAARAPRGARALSVTDWSDGEPRVVEMTLDPARPAREQVDAVFKRARRLKLGAAVAAQRLRDAEQALTRLDAVRARVAEAETAEALEALVIEARAAAPRDFALAAAGSAVGAEGTRKRGAEPGRPYRLYRGAGGARILVGRGAAHNDALTFKVARPHDLWLHVKSLPGAHVVVPLDRGCTCPSDLLVDAAHLAAHFSDARGEASAEIQHTPRRYLRKPRGAAPGVVVVDREKVTVLRVDEDRVTRLLATEEP